MWAFLLGVHLEVELLGQTVCICQPFSVWSSVTAVPTAQCDSLGRLTSLPPLNTVWLFHFPTSGCLVVFNYGFNMHFLDDGPGWAPIHTFFTICISCFMKWLIEIFSSFLTRFHFIRDSQEFFFAFCWESFASYVYWKCLLPRSGLPFNS